MSRRVAHLCGSSKQGGDLTSNSDPPSNLQLHSLTLPPRLLGRSIAGEAEFRELTAEEMAHLKTVASPMGGVRVADLDEGVLRGLQRKGLVYDEVRRWCRAAGNERLLGVRQWWEHFLDEGALRGLQRKGLVYNEMGWWFK